jgi:hypothetical protein
MLLGIAEAKQSDTMHPPRSIWIFLCQIHSIFSSTHIFIPFASLLNKEKNMSMAHA